MKTCTKCGRRITAAEWEKLPLVGHLCMPADEEEPEVHLEYRNCRACHSTLIVPVSPAHAGACALRRARDPDGAPMTRQQSTYARRREDLGRLFYDSTNDEMMLAPTRENDHLKRAILADALEERGLFDLAMRLRRFPPNGRFFSSLLREKVRRAIFGPQKRESYTPQKPVKEILLALVDPRTTRNAEPWLEVHHAVDADSGRRTYLFFGRFLVRNVEDEEEAFEAAAERWPNVFGAVDGNYSERENYRVDRVRTVRRARLLEGSGSSFEGTAYVPSIGVVRFR